jgi:DNA-binding transcriptional ArsR family regulator
MAYVIEETEEGQKAFKTLVTNPKNLNVFNSELSLKVLHELSKQPACAMDIARKLKQHEQKIYYHIRRLEKTGIVKLIRREERAGALAKIYSISYPFLSVKLFDGEYLLDVKTKAKELEFFKPFIENGELDAIIIVGSPDPHGKYGAQASDGSVGIDFALFLGMFLNNVSTNYKLDTEVRDEELKNNLILIGGPKANILIDKINDKLPIYFDTKHEFNLVSSFSKSVYTSDDIGVILKMTNPYNKNKEILVLSGKRFKGTRAAVIAITKHLKEIQGGNKHNGEIARVVQGIDRDADGRIDDVEFLE